MEIEYNKLIKFLYDKNTEANKSHYSDGGNSYRNGYRECLADIIEFIECESKHEN